MKLNDEDKNALLKGNLEIDTYPGLGIKVLRKIEGNNFIYRIIDSETGAIIYTCEEGTRIEEVYPNGIIKLRVSKENDKGHYLNVYYLIKLINKNGEKTVKKMFGDSIFYEIYTNPRCPRLFLLVYDRNSPQGTNEIIYSYYIADENENIYKTSTKQSIAYYTCVSHQIKNRIHVAGDATIITPNNDNDTIFCCDKNTKETQLLTPIQINNPEKSRYNVPIDLLEGQFAVLDRKRMELYQRIKGFNYSRIELDAAKEYKHVAYGLICRNGIILPCEFTEITELEKGENDNYRVYYVVKEQKAGVIKAYKDGTFEYIVPLHEKWNDVENKYSYPFMITKQAGQEKNTFEVIIIEKDEAENHTLRLINGLENTDHPEVERKNGTIKGAKCKLLKTSTTQILVHESSGEKLEYTQIFVKDNFIKASNGDGWDVYFAGPKGFKPLAKKVNQVSWNSHLAFNEQVLTMTQTDEAGNVSTKAYTRRLKYPKKTK